MSAEELQKLEAEYNKIQAMETYVAKHVRVMFDFDATVCVMEGAMLGWLFSVNVHVAAFGVHFLFVWSELLAALADTCCRSAC